MKAFPEVHYEKPGERMGVSIMTIYGGMDLRDYFAAKVMHYWLTYPMASSVHVENMCKGAYHIADEMMKAREK